MAAASRPGGVSDDVALWAVPLAVPDAIFNRLAANLADDEHARANRFRFDRDRRRFTAARGWLRALLGACVDADPAALRFEYAEKGKPSLAHVADRDDVYFNLAHSHDLAVVAVTRLAPLGVDVEYLRPLTDAAQLVERFFSRRENEAFQALPEAQRTAAFFNLWTRKEALIKATGLGLSQPLNRVDVSFLPDEPATLLALDGRADLAQSWRLEHLTLDDGYVGAVAIERAGARVLPCRRIDDPDEF